MALSSSTLSSAIKAALLAAAPAEPPSITDNAALTALCDGIAQAVVAHIVSSAVVTVPATGLVAPPGVAGGPVTGAAVGTVA